MKLIGNLKKKVDNAQTKEEARDAIKKAGMLLDDDELESVSGGRKDPPNGMNNFLNDDFRCPYCYTTNPNDISKTITIENGITKIISYECKCTGKWKEMVKY